MPFQGEHGLRFFLAHLEPISLLLQAAQPKWKHALVFSTRQALAALRERDLDTGLPQSQLLG